MPITASAKKALRQSKKKNLVNQIKKSRVKTAIKLMRKTPSLKLLPTVFSAIDRAVKRKIFHKNKAARLKSQMNKLLSTTGIKSTVKKTVKSKIKKVVRKTAKSVSTKKAS